MNFRVVRFAISEDSYESIITNLPKEDFPVEEIKKVYAMRWGIETSFRELKYAIGLCCFHSKKGGVYHARNIRTFNPLQLL
ncbi:MAG: transposase [Mediterraneibacter gnavus]